MINNIVDDEYRKNIKLKNDKFENTVYIYVEKNDNILNGQASENNVVVVELEYLIILKGNERDDDDISIMFLSLCLYYHSIHEKNRLNPRCMKIREYINKKKKRGSPVYNKLISRSDRYAWHENTSRTYIFEGTRRREMKLSIWIYSWAVLLVFVVVVVCRRIESNRLIIYRFETLSTI